MPIYLRQPAHNPRGSDGQGWNRLSVSLPVHDQCALQPRSYAALVESHDTRRARWGGFGPCVRRGRCAACPIFNNLSVPKELHASGDRILVRLHPDDHQPHLMNHPEKGWASLSYRWTWLDLVRLVGWTIGDQYSDRHGDGFWLHRLPSHADSQREQPA